MKALYLVNVKSSEEAFLEKITLAFVSNNEGPL